MKRRIIIAVLLLSASIGFGTLTERGASARRAIPDPVVTNLNDSGAGSLRQAISDADAGGTITFQAGLTGAITLASELTIDKNLTIQGPGANLLTVSGNNAVRVFNIRAGNVTLSGLTIANGRVTGELALGGGIYHHEGTLMLQQCALSGNTARGSGAGSFVTSFGGGIYSGSGTVNLTACTLSGNSASASGATLHNTSGGGGIFNNDYGTVNLTACTLSDNSASASTNEAYGGGIYTSLGSTVNLTACTLSGNSAPASGGGLYNVGGAVNLTACTLSGNSASNGSGGGIHLAGGSTIIRNTIIAGNLAIAGPDVYVFFGGVTSHGYNLIGNNDRSGLPAGNPNANQDIVGASASPIAPRLGPLANNGGPTKTMALLPCSPAIDKGKSFGLSADQRGQTRPVDDPAIPPATGGDNSDIGAFEAPDSLVCNSAPIAVCQNVTVSAGSNCTASVTAAQINNGSSDPDGDPISLSLNSYGPFGLGSHAVTLTVTDSNGVSSSCSATVTVVDQTPPTITLYGANPMTVECPYGFVDPGATASDNCAGSVAVTTLGSVNAAVPGSYTITYSANDGRGNTTTRTRTVNVVDTAAPTLTLKPDIQLWPPDHTYRTLTMSQMVQSVSDGCNTALSLNDVKIEKVTSDEPDNAKGNSDGETINDILIAADCKSVQLRSERDEKKNGRVYVVTLRVKDASGNTTRKDFKVSVPINQSGAAAVPGAAALTKTSSCP